MGTPRAGQKPYSSCSSLSLPSSLHPLSLLLVQTLAFCCCFCCHYKLHAVSWNRSSFPLAIYFLIGFRRERCKMWRRFSSKPQRWTRCGHNHSSHLKEISSQKDTGACSHVCFYNHSLTTVQYTSIYLLRVF